MSNSDKIIDNAPDNSLYNAISNAITSETIAIDIEVGYFYFVSIFLDVTCQYFALSFLG